MGRWLYILKSGEVNTHRHEALGGPSSVPLQPTPAGPGLSPGQCKRYDPLQSRGKIIRFWIVKYHLELQNLDYKSFCCPNS